MAFFVRSQTTHRFVSRLAGKQGAPMLLAVALGVIAAALMRMPALALPLERDEGAYAYVAQAWLRGELPYRDVFDHKPPLIYLLYMPTLLLREPSALDVRLWNSILFLIQLPIIYMLGHRLWNESAAMLATVLYAIVGSAFSLQALVLNTEQALVLPALIGLFALLRAIESDRSVWPLVFGFMLGLVSLIKPTAVPFLLPLALLGSAASYSARLRRLLLAGVGLLLPFVPVVALWGFTGALAELSFALVGYNRLYAAQTIERWTVGEILSILAFISPLLICAIGGAALAGWREPRRRQRLAVALWTLGFTAAGLVGLRAYVHYYYPALHGLVLLAVGTVTALGQNAAGPPARLARPINLAAIGLLVLVLVLPSVSDTARLRDATPTALARAMYGQDGQDYFAVVDEVAAHIRARTSPNDHIYVWGSEPAIYVLSERRASSRFIYTYPLDLVPGAARDLWQDLRRRPPAMVVAYRGTLPPEIREMATGEGLRQETTIGGFELWAAPRNAVR